MQALIYGHFAQWICSCHSGTCISFIHCVHLQFDTPQAFDVFLFAHCRDPCFDMTSTNYVVVGGFPLDVTLIAPLLILTALVSYTVQSRIAHTQYDCFLSCNRKSDM